MGEPVNNYVGDSLAYERWGKRFPAVFDWRGDGFIWTVTERYHTNTTTLTVHIFQENGTPVDGAKVKMLSDYEYGGIRIATCGYTDASGTVSFTIGGERDIYLNISSLLGMYPSDPDDGVLVIEDSDPNIEYEWTYNYTQSMAAVEPEEAEPPHEPLEHFQLNIEYTMLCEATYGQIFRYSDFVAEIGNSHVDFFICDAENYNRFTMWMDFEAFLIDSLTESGEISFALPDDGVWYAVFSNINSLSNYQRLDMTAELSIDDEFSAADKEKEIPSVYALFPNYPNPFNSQTNIRFSLAKSGITNLIVYNINGREVFKKLLGHFQVGPHTVGLDFGRMASGAYFYELESGDFKAAKRMILLK